jgi:hypothetical protein
VAEDQVAKSAGRLSLSKALQRVAV